LGDESSRTGHDKVQFLIKIHEKNAKSSPNICIFEKKAVSLQREMNEGTPKRSPLRIKKAKTHRQKIYNLGFMSLKEQLQEWIGEYLKGTDYELITLEVSAGNDILVEVDRLAGVDVDFCAELNRFLVAKIEDRFADGAQTDLDYSLEVGSVSLTDPFKTKMQFEKNLGHDVEVMISTKGQSTKYKGQLV
jgi:ribosome maturation factor RimP